MSTKWKELLARVERGEHLNKDLQIKLFDDVAREMHASIARKEKILFPIAEDPSNEYGKIVVAIQPELERLGYVYNPKTGKSTSTGKPTK